ncbi:hypothetical protein OXPF_41590 [Oxobacter pfennigii]|uniref:Uncharacterized protein n=1 Tax=Oxobacter pfennigii TaxID=36849 RepID=A0A0P8Y7C7_9CLOT|nr:hypothetical protein OXPF_41590 [Oxobacter pfennigii]
MYLSGVKIEACALLAVVGGREYAWYEMPLLVYMKIRRKI